VDTSELCLKIKSAPFTMTLVSGPEAQAAGKLWWPLK
jgi:hypothetical protein